MQRLIDKAIENMQTFLMINFFNLTGLQLEGYHGKLMIEIKNGKIDYVHTDRVLKHS